MMNEARGKILVVDDEVDMVKLIKFTLEKEKYKVITAGDGIEALEKTKSENPDLIILDVILPKMNGYIFVLELKKLKKFKKIPIIVLTIKELMKDLFKIEGIQDFLVKPFERDELVARVKRNLKHLKKRSP